MAQQPPLLSSALDNPGFRRLTLWAAGVPIAVFYLWQTLVQPFLARPQFNDFSMFYAAAAALRAGTDPYAPFFASGRYDYSQAYYIYPPLTAWLVSPLVPLGGENAALLAVVTLQLCVAAFAWLVYRALRPVHPHEVALGVILILGFAPVSANLWNAQVNLGVLALGGAALLAYVRGDRWWGGAGLGVALALKPLQPAVGLLLIWGRRWRMVAATAVAGLAASLLPGPGLFIEYVTRVLAGAAGGTGFRDNAAPAGFIERMLHPATFYDGTAPGGLEVRLLQAAVALAILGISWSRLGGTPREDGQGRAAEFALAVAASPLLLTLAHTFHLMLLLLPILVLLRLGIARRDRLALAAAAAAWLLIGPIHAGMLSAIVAHFSADLPLRVWNESQLLGLLVLWAGCLHSLGWRAGVAVRSRPSSRPAPL